MASTVELKLAEHGDAAAILAFLQQAKTETDAITIPHLEKVTAREESRNIDEINQSDDCIIMLAMLGDQLIGMVTVMRTSVEEKTGELGVVVDKEYWRNGIGQMLVDEAEYWFNHYSSLDHMDLTVYEDNLPAINLYRKMGFVVTDHLQINGQPSLRMDYQVD